MSKGWNFWIKVADVKNYVSNRFNYNEKICGLPVMQTDISGYTINYPSSFHASNELLKVPVASNIALVFDVQATTNCNKCICEVCLTTGETFENSAWLFKASKSYDLGAVAVAVSNALPVFSAGILSAASLIFLTVVAVTVN